MARVMALDGISGSGKTTTARILELYLLHKGYKILVVNEKEHEPFRSWAISWHKRPPEDRVFAWQNVVDVAEARAIVHTSLAPAIARSDIVMFDRSLYTSAVYQSSEQISPREIVEVNLSSGAIEPEIVVLFLGDAWVCHGRVLERSRKKTPYKLPATTETAEQIQEYLKRYRGLSLLLKDATVVDASLPTATKTRLILDVLRRFAMFSV